jgi:hypothetical protein
MNRNGYCEDCIISWKKNHPNVPYTCLLCKSFDCFPDIFCHFCVKKMTNPVRCAECKYVSMYFFIIFIYVYIYAMNRKGFCEKCIIFVWKNTFQNAPYTCPSCNAPDSFPDLTCPVCFEMMVNRCKCVQCRYVYIYIYI